MVGIDGVAALTILALRLCSHCVVIGRPAQARNALLAAYFILDDDGVRGLSREQLVGVLTTEAGVGIDTDQVGWWASEDNSLFSHLNASALERQQERFSYREMFSEKTGAERVRLAQILLCRSEGLESVSWAFECRSAVEDLETQART